MNTLSLKGSINLDQFWPQGAVGRAQGSDADTVKVKVDLASVRHDGTATRFLEKADVIGQGRKAVLKNGHIEVRLQGIDAPELHYPTNVKNEEAAKPNGHFRQYLGERSTEALFRWLDRKTRSNELDCVVTTHNVANPNQVFDPFGRLIGDISCGGDSLNAFLLRQGHAFPTFYASMLNEEITHFRALAQAAKRQGKGVWEHYSTEASFDPDLVYRREADDEADDSGPVLLPKLFRRCAKTWVRKGSLRQLRQSILESEDVFFPTEDFLLFSGAALRQILWGDPEKGAFEDAGRGKLRLALEPWDMVFVEGESTLVEQGGRRRIVSW